MPSVRPQRAPALCYFLTNWVAKRLEDALLPEGLLARLHLLHAPFEEGPRAVKLDESRGVIELVPLKRTGVLQSTLYRLAVVDEAHHVYKDPASKTIDASYAIEVLLLLSDFCIFSRRGAAREVPPAVGEVY